MNMNVFPLVMTPAFRHGSQTPWGGHALKELFGKDTPEDITGESLEVSAGSMPAKRCGRCIPSGENP